MKKINNWSAEKLRKVIDCNCGGGKFLCPHRVMLENYYKKVGGRYLVNINGIELTRALKCIWCAKMETLYHSLDFVGNLFLEFNNFCYDCYLNRPTANNKFTK